MDERSHNLLHIRPDLNKVLLSNETSIGEQFQNTTLRPIVKLQKELFVAVFQNYIKKHKNAFYKLSLEKRFLYIENAIQKDIKFRNSLKGMVLGQFTIEEYEIYIQNSSSLNKRMMHLVIESLKSNMQLFEQVEALV